jgi:peptide-methionine (R)-S-oxide reductase
MIFIPNPDNNFLFKRLLTDLVSVGFGVLLSQLFDSFCGANIRKLILTPQKESKIGQNNPQNRRNPNLLTVSKRAKTVDKSPQKMGASIEKYNPHFLGRFSPFSRYLNRKLLSGFGISWIFLFTQFSEISKDQTVERAFSGKYLYEESQGVYLCAQCQSPLFDSTDKYDSGSGWPSFKKCIDSKSVYYLEDSSLSFKRYAVLCRHCNHSLGHVFNDGPPPKGLRYCIYSINLIFQPLIEVK